MSAYKPIHAPQLDWLSFAPQEEILAPHPDLFEVELEQSLHGVDQSQFPFLNVDIDVDPYHYFKSDNPGLNGPPSTITISSESAYETLSNHSDSLYSFPRSPTYSSMDSVYANDLQINFQKFTVQQQTPVTETAVAAPQPINATNANGTLHLIDDTDADSNSFGELPISPYDSASNSSGSFEFDSNQQSSVNPVSSLRPQEFYVPSSQQHLRPAPQPTSRTSPSSISPITIPHPIPRLNLHMADASNTASNHGHTDSRRKYQCPSCPRAFARAYNLKTHMATHDPQRPKPFTCPHKSCGRSFSRKHDLGRHLVSIHHDEPHDKKIGVQNGARHWCDSCGKGWTSASSACRCPT